MEHMQHVTLSLNYLLHKFRIVAFFFFPKYKYNAYIIEIGILM